MGKHTDPERLILKSFRINTLNKATTYLEIYHVTTLKINITTNDFLVIFLRYHKTFAPTTAPMRILREMTGFFS